MGCHTWFYKRIDSPTDEQVRETVKDRCQKEIQFLEKLIHRREEIDPDLLEAYPEWTPEWATSMLPFWQKIYDFANGGERGCTFEQFKDAYNFVKEKLSQVEIEN